MPLEYHPLIQKSSWLKTGQPGHGLIDIPSSISSEEEDEEELIERRSKRDSYDKLDKRTRAERLLFYFVGMGNVDGMREVMQRYPHDKFNINAKNMHGYDLLMCAVKKGDLKMVQAVLREVSPETIHIQDGLMKAVKYNRKKCLLEILQFEEERRNDGKKKRISIELLHKGEFESEVTPLMMAAVKGFYDIIEILFERGERMPKLHYPRCKCRICKSYRESGEARDLERIKKRIVLLEAMCSVEWLLFMSGKDKNLNPISEVITVKGEIRRCLTEEVEWRQEYERVLAKAEEIPGMMIALCGTVDELKVLLSATSESSYPLIRLAVDQEMKAFLAEAGMQFILEREFTGVGGWKPKSLLERVAKSFAIFFIMIYFPIINLLLWAVSFCKGLQNKRAVEYLKCPESRFYMKLGSYHVFIMVLLVLATKERLGKPEEDLSQTSFWFRWIAFTYVLSQISSLVRGFHQNPEYFSNRTWNRIQMLTCLLFWVRFVTWFWEDILGFRKLITNADSTYTESPLMASIGPCAFAVAITLSILQFFRYLIIVPPFGRVQTQFAALVKGKWKTMLLYILLATVTLSLVGTKFKRKGESWGLVGLLIVDGVLATYLSVTGTGLFGGAGCSATTSLSEWRYQMAAEWLYYSKEDVGLTPPFNLIPYWGSNLFQLTAQDEDEMSSTEAMRQQYPYLVKKLFERYFRKKLNQ